jgi:hypothetical protein
MTCESRLDPRGTSSPEQGLQPMKMGRNQAGIPPTRKIGHPGCGTPPAMRR